MISPITLFPLFSKGPSFTDWIVILSVNGLESIICGRGNRKYLWSLEVRLGLMEMILENKGLSNDEGLSSDVIQRNLKKHSKLTSNVELCSSRENLLILPPSQILPSSHKPGCDFQSRTAKTLSVFMYGLRSFSTKGRTSFIFFLSSGKIISLCAILATCQKDNG